MDAGKEIKNAIKNEKLIIGGRTVLKNLKKGTLQMIIQASNCPAEIKKNLDHYTKVSSVKLEGFNGNSVQLGELCGKPFSILVVGIKK